MLSSMGIIIMLAAIILQELFITFLFQEQHQNRLNDIQDVHGTICVSFRNTKGELVF